MSKAEYYFEVHCWLSNEYDEIKKCTGGMV